MKVGKLTLRNFRNVEECTFTPDSKVNFLIGANGQGKTSVIEALSLLATLRSFRGAKAQELIQWGHLQSEVACTIYPDDSEGGLAHDWATDLKITYQASDPQRDHVSKTAFINGKSYKNSTTYLSQRFGSVEMGFHTVIFNPSDHDLVRNDPQTRRGYVDKVLTAEDVNYFKILQKYQKITQQKNAILKMAHEPGVNRKDLRDQLIGFMEPMVHLAAQITFRRLNWIERLRTALVDAMSQIAPHQSQIRLIYLSNWVPEIDGLSLSNRDLGPVHFAGHGHLPSLELLEQAFWKKFSALEPAEWKSGHSLVGPHRDDWAFFFGDQPLKGHGSQGEVRSALLALKLSEIELFRNATGHRPLFLLDDFSSELDSNRRSFLLRFLKETDLQVFVTATEGNSFTGKRFKVSGGKVTEDTETATQESEREVEHGSNANAV